MWPRLQILILVGCLRLATAEPTSRVQADRLVHESSLGQAWREIHAAPAKLNEDQARAFAQACLEVGQPVIAFEYFRDLEHKYPGAYYQFRCGIAAEKAGQTSLAKIYFLKASRSQTPGEEAEKSLALEKIGRRVPFQPDLAKDRGIVLLADCLQPAAAVRELKLAVQADPKNKDLPGICALAEIGAGQYPAAVGDYRRSSLKYPGNYAWALYLNGEVEAAEKICNRASKTPQSAASNLHTRARISLAHNQPQEALRFLNQLLKTETHNPFYYEERAEVLNRINRKAEAQADQARAEKLRHLPRPLPRLN